MQVQSCRGVEIWRSRGAEQGADYAQGFVSGEVEQRCRVGCTDPEVQGCRDTELHSEVQRCRCAEGQRGKGLAEVEGTEVQKQVKGAEVKGAGVHRCRGAGVQVCRSAEGHTGFRGSE